jgi:hypothetical protein
MSNKLITNRILFICALKPKTMRLILAVCLAIFLPGLVVTQQKIEFEIKNYENDTLILGNYYGEKTVVKDTIFAIKKGKFEYQNDESLPPGMYIALLKPDNSFVQLLINGKEKDIKVSFDSKDLANVKFKGSADNDLFYSYLEFLKDKRILADTLRARMAKAEAADMK